MLEQSDIPFFCASGCIWMWVYMFASYFLSPNSDCALMIFKENVICYILFNHIKHYNTNDTGIGKLNEMFSNIHIDN